MMTSKKYTRARYRGFSLLEVLIALVVIAVGLLGIAKMQMLAFSETSVASKRSLAAIEAASLAASMHADRAYWASGMAPSVFSVSGTNISDPVLSQNVSCNNAEHCTSEQFAAYDVQQWAIALAAILPNPISTVNCTNVQGVPVSCTIQVTWSEQQTGLSAQSETGPKMIAPTYTLYVEP